MLTFHGSEELKQKYLSRVIEHEKADEIRKGAYWEEGKWCAVGCILHSGNHFNFESELGIPAWVAYLVDRLFEGSPNIEAKFFPREFIKSVPVGKDEGWWDGVNRQFLAFVIKSSLSSIPSNAKYDEQRKLTQDLITEISSTSIKIERINNLKRKLRECADAAFAACSTAYSAADATAAAAADSAADSADSADAADAAAAAAAYAYTADATAYTSAACVNARQSKYSELRKEFIRLISEV